MSNQQQVEKFMEMAGKVGAETVKLVDLQSVAGYIASQVSGQTLVPSTFLAEKHGLARLLSSSGVNVFKGDFRGADHVPAAGVTFSNFALADTGTIVLESTAEDIRLATTLPEKHFILVDPATILKDNLAAAAPMNVFHAGNDPVFVAYITGPSRTADIERVLTIGCHGPRELHILLVDGISDDMMEN